MDVEKAEQKEYEDQQEKRIQRLPAFVHKIVTMNAKFIDGDGSPRYEEIQQKKRIRVVVGHLVTTGGVSMISGSALAATRLLHHEHGCKNYQIQADLRAQIAANSYRYHRLKYQEKQKEIEETLRVLLVKVWAKSPHPNVSRDWAEYVTLLITFAEFYNILITSTTTDLKNNGELFAPTDLVDMMYDYLTTIKECEKSGMVDWANFSFLLVLRDQIFEAIRDHYRYFCPLLRKQYVQNRNDAPCRYQPYDFEWLVGSVLTTSLRHPYVKYLYDSRLAQVDISVARMEILAERCGVQLNFPRGLRFPFPDSYWTDSSLFKLLDTAEARRQFDYARAQKLVSTAAAHHPELAFAEACHEFHQLCGRIRARKLDLMELVSSVNISESDRIGIIRALGVIATMDSHILLLSKVYAPYMDTEIGMYGIAFPESVTKIMKQLYVCVDVDACASDRTFTIITAQMNDMRTEVMRKIQEFHEVHEDDCLAQFNKSASLLYMFQDEPEPGLNIDVHSFPTTTKYRAFLHRNMMWQEQWERKRLFYMLQEIKYSHHRWPKTHGVIKFSINRVSSKRVMAFVSNFSKIMSLVDIECAGKEADDAYKKPGKDTSFALKINEVIADTAKRFNCVPDSADLVKAFDIVVRGHTDEGRFDDPIRPLALQNHLADITSEQIGYMNNSWKLPVSHGRMDVAGQIAQCITSTFIEIAGDHYYGIMNKKVPMKSRVLDADTAKRVCLHDRSGSDPGCDCPEDAGRCEGLSDEDIDEEDEDEEEEDEEEEDEEEVEKEEDDDVYHDASDMSFMLNSLTLGSAAGAIFFEDPNVVFADYDTIPEDVIDDFLNAVIGVNLPEEFDLSAPHFNVPID